MMRKDEIRLSPDHPTSLETVFFTPTVYAPLVINSEFWLVDGYRRYNALSTEEVHVTRLDCSSLYDAAFEMNRPTRDWDDIDIFLWARWARSLGVTNNHLHSRSFSEDLWNAPPFLLSALADRHLQMGQALKILQSPSSACSFFVEILSSTLRLNVNETALFIDMVFDLANRNGFRDLKNVLTLEPLAVVVNDPALNKRQKGEALLKAMRKLRYPLYQKKTEEFSTAWRQLNLQKVQVNKGLFLDRGILEITISAGSQLEMLQQVRELSHSLNTDGWDHIWPDELREKGNEEEHVPSEKK